MASSKKDDYIKKKPIRWRREITIPAPIDTAASMGSKGICRPLTPKYVKGKGAPSFDATSFDYEERFDLHDDVLVTEFIKVRRKQHASGAIRPYQQISLTY